MTHPKPDNASLACFICGKQKGQPPERCNGHYDNAPQSETVGEGIAEMLCSGPNAPTPTGPVLSAELDYVNLWALSRGAVSGKFSEWPMLQHEADKALSELEAIRALLAQRDKRVEHLLYALRTIRGYFADLENGIREDDPLKPIRMMAHAKFHRVIEAAMKEPPTTSQDATKQSTYIRTPDDEGIAPLQRRDGAKSKTLRGTDGLGSTGNK